MKLLWCTDTHLDCASTESRDQWLQKIKTADADGVVLTGDISNGNRIIQDLEWLSNEFSKPIYFVLGNHDYYHSDFDTINHRVRSLVDKQPNLTWLDIADPININNTILIGHSGWGDGRNGDFLSTPVRINDHRLIGDFVGKARTEILSILNAMGTTAATLIEQRLQLADPKHTKILVATHVPPFAESAWHNDEWGTYEWLPDFTCKAIGDVLLRYALENPHRDVTVLCGHGHSPGMVQMEANLKVLTGGASYGSPDIAGIISF